MKCDETTKCCDEMLGASKSAQPFLSLIVNILAEVGDINLIAEDWRQLKKYTMHLYIKNMVCDRCISAVQKLLDEEKIRYTSIQLGEVDLPDEPSKQQIEKLEKGLGTAGFELLDDARSKIVEKIKNTIVTLIHRNEDILNMKVSSVLEDSLQKEYHYLSTLFSSAEGMTIEKYTILQRIERAKELITYNELSLSEIADQMGYSSVQHLSQQFKKETGLTPTQFRNLKGNQRKPLDKV